MAQATAPTNLPAQLTSFVGRAPELAELAVLLRQARLVTVAGAAGLGKTRLAVEVAAGTLGQHPDGVWFVGLGAVTEPALVPRELALALGAREQLGERLLDTLAAHVGDRRVLLLLDNCEHLLDSVAQLAEALLRGCPRLRFLVTSREPLRVPGERVWRIAPLAVPDRAAAPSFDVLTQCEAVQLFQARASLVQPRFELSPSNALVVAQVCRRLDGIPLAIELAAARAEMMSVGDILDRLEDRFRLLTGGSRTAMPRHQTLQAALDWGHRLLTDGERRLFRRLSVFPASFDVAAAETVCSDLTLPPPDVLEHLSRLVDKSLVAPEAARSGHNRYRMLETVRQYAAERLLDCGEAAEVRLRHADHCLDLAERAVGYEWQPGRTEWLERLEAEHVDLRTALEWCREHDQARCVRLATALGWFWLTREHLSEGREWLEQVLALTSLTPLDRARVDYPLARLASWQGDHVIARRLAEDALEIFEGLGDELQAGWTRNLLGTICDRAGDHAEGGAYLEAVVATTRDDVLRADSLLWLGELQLQRGDLARARQYLERSLAEAARQDAHWQIATAALFVGITDFFEGHLEPARRRAVESIHGFGQLGNRFGQCGSLDLFAALALAGREPGRSLRLSAAAAHIRETMRAPLPPRWEELVASLVVAPARAVLGERADGAWDEGSRMTLEEALACALTEPAAAAVPSPLQLSRREREVASLVSRGLTNRQIAERLVIAERTVEGHLERIRSKLDMHSRTEIAVWVVEHSASGSV
jgi:non-specific serine/threonine protein kinase